MKKEHMLVGRTLLGVQVAKDRQAIKFILDGDEPCIAKCDGDCCSYTWVEHIEVPSLPGIVLAVEDIDMPSAEPPGGKHVEQPEEVAFYGLKITLSTGHLIIDYRNDSNGYYGGRLSWPSDDYFYGGVHGQNVSKLEWVDVKEDV
jgi:hypothetical protein